MAPQGLKSGARKVLLGGNCNQPFQNFTGGADAASPIVMPRLDPGIHDETPRAGAYRKPAFAEPFMDCRDKPGTDEG
jgi:hypothetical protein